MAGKRLTEQRFLTQEVDLKQKAKTAAVGWKKEREAFRYKDISEFRDLLKECGITHYYEKCCVCGWKQTVVDLAHIKPFNEGGNYELSNIAPLCPNCHRCYDSRRFGKGMREKMDKFVKKMLSLSAP